MRNPILGIVASAGGKPAPLPGYKVWLDASDTSTITHSSNAVSAWTDKSANAYVFEQLTSTAKPATNTRTLNSLNVLDFDGTSDFLLCTAAASTWNFMHNATGSTIFMVVNSDANSGANALLSTNEGGTTTPGVYYYVAPGGADQYHRVLLSGTSGTYVVNNRIDAAATWLNGTTQALGLLTDPSNGTTLARAKLYRNNNTDVAVNGGADGGAFSTNDANNSLNICGGAGNWFNGMVAEILIYDSQLSSGDITSNMNYLKTKWGI
jgi:hypothetical protein